jgi:16S rRNA (uracil1498-N3)-methyltransferase
MAVRSVYLPEPQIENNRIRIDGDEHQHLKIARIEPGEVIEIFDGKGTAWTVVALTVGKRETVAEVKESRRMERDRFELIVAIALIRTAAFEFALEKVVEIGVTRIIPFAADRSNVTAGNRHERWQRIVSEAAKQSKQYHLPALDAPASFDQVIALSAASKILFAERDGGPLKSALSGVPVLYLIGPEGGWTDRELSAARNNGFHAVSLGAAILKAETAAIVGTSVIRYELGR